MQGWSDDLRHALRLYLRTPFQSATAAILIAVAMAFATGFFSLYSDLALQEPGGVAEPDRLVSIGLDDGSRFQAHLTGSLREGLAQQLSSLERVGGLNFFPGLRAEVNEEHSRVTTGATDADLWRAVDPQLAQGRGLEPEEFAGQGDAVAVLSHEWWQEALGGAPEIIGSEIRVKRTDDNSGQEAEEHTRFRVVGILEPGFGPLRRGTDADLWIPHSTLMSRIFGADPEGAGEFHKTAIGQLRAGTDLATLEQELEERQDPLSEEHDEISGQRVLAHQALGADPHSHADAVRQVSLFAASGLLVAVIAAGNLTLFFLARAPARRPEMALRRAFGARTPRLMRQLFTESGLLVLIGAALGLVLVLWLGLALRELPIFEGVSWQQEGVIDWWVLVFALGLAALLAVAVGLAPALDLSRDSISERSRQGRIQAGWTQRLLAATQVAVAAVVLAVAGLFLQATLQAQLGAQGFEPEGVQVLEGDFTEGDFAPSTDAIRDMRRDMRERLEALPGVEAVGFGPVPLVEDPPSRNIAPLDGREDELRAQAFTAHPAWLEILGTQLLRGSFPQVDEDGTATVTREFARQAFGELDAVGREFDADPPANIRGPEPVTYRVVAVIEDLPMGHPADPPEPVAILNGVEVLDGMHPVLVAGDGDSELLLSEAAEPWADGSPPMEPSEALALGERFHEALAPDRSRAVLSGAAGLLVLVLAALGFYGTLRFMVDAGRFDYALRAALGASPRDLQRHVLIRGLTLGLPGLAAGLVLAGLALVWLREWFELYMLSLWLPLLLTGLVLGAILLLAVWLPARRVAAMNPAAALRDE